MGKKSRGKRKRKAWQSLGFRQFSCLDCRHDFWEQAKQAKRAAGISCPNCLSRAVSRKGSEVAKQVQALHEERTATPADWWAGRGERHP